MSNPSESVRHCIKSVMSMLVCHSIFFYDILLFYQCSGSTGVTARASVELPFYSKYILLAAYLASYNPPKTDKRFFSKVYQQAIFYTMPQMSFRYVYLEPKISILINGAFDKEYEELF